MKKHICEQSSGHWKRQRDNSTAKLVWFLFFFFFLLYIKQEHYIFVFCLCSPNLFLSIYDHYKPVNKMPGTIYPERKEYQIYRLAEVAQATVSRDA